MGSEGFRRVQMVSEGFRWFQMVSEEKNKTLKTKTTYYCFIGFTSFILYLNKLAPLKLET